MTLKQWSDLTGVLPTHPTTEHGAVSVLVPLDVPMGPVWDLEDYTVVGHYGAIVWLLPRRPAYNL